MIVKQVAEGVTRYFTDRGLQISEHAVGRIVNRFKTLDKAEAYINNLDFRKSKKCMYKFKGKERATYKIIDTDSQMVFVLDSDKKIIITAFPSASSDKNIDSSLKRERAAHNCKKNKTDFKRAKEKIKYEELGEEIYDIY